ncbi:hypothetical protein VTJ04DRAFT_2322 [Mycothermus thermophilus]|uniref:uncharacterized protein n=1 Tax=Humicola insolens TaxID=85995 RepID=UPI003743C97C
MSPRFPAPPPKKHTVHTGVKPVVVPLLITPFVPCPMADPHGNSIPPESPRPIIIINQAATLRPLSPPRLPSNTSSPPRGGFFLTTGI